VVVIVVIPRHAPRGLHGTSGERIEAVAAVLPQPRAAGGLRFGIGIVAARELAPFDLFSIRSARG